MKEYINQEITLTIKCINKNKLIVITLFAFYFISDILTNFGSSKVRYLISILKLITILLNTITVYKIIYDIYRHKKSKSPRIGSVFVMFILTSILIAFRFFFGDLLPSSISIGFNLLTVILFAFIVFSIIPFLHLNIIKHHRILIVYAIKHYIVILLFLFSILILIVCAFIVEIVINNILIEVYISSISSIDNGLFINTFWILFFQASLFCYDHRKVLSGLIKQKKT